MSKITLISRIGCKFDRHDILPIFQE